VQPRSRSYHSARSGLALDDSWDEYCIIKYVSHLEKNIKEKKLLDSISLSSPLMLSVAEMTC
jgi:hypothetical protein